MAAASSGVNLNGAPAWTAGIQLGSLISVISLSEIRYEGFLIEFTPHPFTIGLRNVRLLGTEGRKKSGRQIPPSDKIYEYIYLRGNNIKNLWIISSPSTQSNLLVPEDPAILRPRIAQPTPTTMASISYGAVGANVRNSAQLILPGTSSFQFNQSRITMGSASHGAAEGANVRTRAQPILPGTSSFQSNQSRIPMGSTSHGAAEGANVGTRAQPILPGTSSFQSNQSRITMGSTSHGVAEGANVRTRAQPIFPGTSFQFNQSRDPSASSSNVQRSLLPPPPANNSRLAVPNYLQALAGSSGMMSYFQQKLPPPPASLLASKAPVQQQVQRHNENTSAVGESTFFARHPPLLLRRSATSSNAVPPLVSTPSVQSNLGKSSPSQSLQIKDIKGKAPLAPVMALNFKAKAAVAPVMESLPSGSTEETLGSSLKQTTETGSIPSHHEKGQSSQGKEQFIQVHGGPNEDPGRSLEGENEKPLVKRGFKEDFNFEAMNKKFNKKEVWDYFSKSKGEAGGVRDNTKPVYCKEEFFDSLSYGATDDESAKVRLSEQKDKETFGAEIPIIQQHRGPRKQVWRRIVK